MKRACFAALLILANVCAVAQLQPVKDVDTRINSDVIAGANFFRKSGNLLYFSRTDEYGSELWRTDGTKAGTFRLTDNTKGFGASVASTRLTADFDGELVFASGVEGGTNGKLWKTDGTVEGTRLVAEATLDGKWLSIATMVKVGDRLILLMQDVTLSAITTYHLFAYSNTTEEITYLKPVGEASLVTAATGASHASFAFFGFPNPGYRVWSSDGTPAGTAEVAVLNSSVFVNEMVDLDNVIIMTTNNQKVIKYDRSTQMVSDVIDVSPGAFIQRMFKGSPTEAVVSTNVSSLVIDGNPANTTAPFGSYIVFDSYYDGTKALLLGRNPVDNEINLFDSDQVMSPGEDFGSLGIATTIPSANARIIPVGDRVFTVMWSPTAGFEPAVVEGNHVQLIKDINPGTGGSNPQSFAELNGKAVFAAASDGSALEIWTTDGTEANTQRLLDPSTRTRDGVARNFYSYKDKAWFLGTETLNNDLWTSSENGQQVVKEKTFNFGAILGIMNGELYMASQAEGLMKTDGVNTTLLKDFANKGFFSISVGDDNVVLGNKLLFPMSYPTSGMAGEIKGNELWVTDGTPGGSFMLKDINPGGVGGILTSSIQGRLKAVNSTTAVFTANDGVNGYELWTTDGTTAGTVMVKDINPGLGPSAPTNMVAVNGFVYFRAFDGTSSEIWKTDGTPAGTVAVTDLSLEGGYFLQNVVAHDNKVFFAANEDNAGWALYKIETDQVVKIKDLNTANSTNQVPKNFFSANGFLYFSSDDGEHGQELWISDGTAAGTKLIDIVQGSEGSYPRPLFAVDGQLFLAADGHLCHTTGYTTPLIEKLSDLDPLYIQKVGSSLFYTAFSNTYGIELFRMPYPKFNQTINFTVADRKLADGDFTLSATTSTGLPVTFSSTSEEIAISGTSVDVKTAGSATITATQAGNGAFNTVSSSKTFCINPDKPNIIVLTMGNNILTSSSATGNQWFLAGAAINGATSNTYTVAETGLYSVQVSADGCKSEMSEGMQVTYSGIEDEAIDLSVYPNPVNDKLTISWPSQSEVELTVITAQGKAIQDVRFSGSYLLNAAGYSHGIYILRLKTSSGIIHRKFLKH